MKPSPESDVSKRAGNPGRRRLAFLVAAALIVAAAIAGVILGHLWRQRMPPPSLGLDVKRRAGQFLVSWDRQAPGILGARRGVLAVRDGSYEDQLELNPLQLRNGSLAYASAGADIQFRMDVFRDRGPRLSESIRVLTPAMAAVRKDPAPERITPPAVPAKLPPRTLEAAPVVHQTPPMRPAPITAGYIAPKIVHSVEPVIPARSIASLAPEARIDVKVRIGADGRVTEAQVTSRNGHPDESLDFAALRAAWQFQFQAARLNDRSVPSAMILSFRFVR